MTPANVSELHIYLGEDGNIWAVNQADGRAYGLVPATEGRVSGQPAPTSSPAPSGPDPGATLSGQHVNDIYTDTNGDLIVKQITGPNAGKSVNLTYTKWA